MGKMNDFVLDFLEIVQHKEKETYEHKEWDWENLPPIETMWEVMSRYDEKNSQTGIGNKQNKQLHPNIYVY